MRNSKRALLAFLAVYAAALVALAPRLSLWLDEILTLNGARQPSWPDLLDFLKATPGGTPLAFLVPGAAIQLMGYSTLTGRITSVMAAVAILPAVYWLGRRIGLRSPLIAVVVFALCPLQFRYALEARPYALALCLSAWATVVFLSLLDRPDSTARKLAYIALTMLGAWTVAYSLFVPAAHLLWAMLTPRGRAIDMSLDRRLAAASGPALALGGIAILGWYAYMRGDWQSVLARDQLTGTIDWHWILVVLHEFPGAGYWGTLLLWTGVGAGLCRNSLRGELHSFWFCYAVLPILMTPVADSVLGYFFATRQLIWVLVPLILLFVAGAETLGSGSVHRGRWGTALIAAFLLLSLYEDVHWMTRPREDWQAAATEVTGRLGTSPETGGCVVFTPEDAELLYTFSTPALASRKCVDLSAGAEPARLVLAESPYDPQAATAKLRDQLTVLGYQSETRAEFEGPVVEVWQRE